MPIYTYACTACELQIERRQSFSDAPLTTCESCGGSLRRVLHPVGVIFKGSGFYNTDYKKPSGNGTKTESTTPAKSESASSDSASTTPTTSDAGASSSSASPTTASSTSTSSSD